MGTAIRPSHANGCERLWTVANGWERLRTVAQRLANTAQLNPQTPEGKREPCYACWKKCCKTESQKDRHIDNDWKRTYERTKGPPRVASTEKWGVVAPDENQQIDNRLHGSAWKRSVWKRMGSCDAHVSVEQSARVVPRRLSSLITCGSLIWSGGKWIELNTQAACCTLVSCNIASVFIRMWKTLWFWAPNSQFNLLWQTVGRTVQRSNYSCGNLMKAIDFSRHV